MLLGIMTSGCLGKHETCPHCGGLGLDPDYLFLRECPVCDGDGEVGLFIEDEKAEDIISYIILIILIASLIGAIVEGIAKSTKSKSKGQKVPPVIIQQQVQREYYQKYCESCGRTIPIDSILCPYCGYTR